jgi:hypothetical protein
MQLHPAIAFGAALAGGSVGGLLGAFMALPAAAVIQATVSSYLTRHEVVEDELTRADHPADTTTAEAEDAAAEHDDEAEAETTSGDDGSLLTRLTSKLRGGSSDPPSDGV